MASPRPTWSAVRPPRSGSAPDQLTTVFTPLAGLLGLAALLSLAAWLYEPFHRHLLIVAVCSATTAAALALFYLYRETRGWAVADHDLHQSENRFSNVVDAAMDPIVTVDEQQRIVLFNPAAEQAFGYAKADVIGSPLEMLIPERFRVIHHQHVERFGTTGVTSRRMGAQAVLVALRSDGSEFPIEASISQHIDGERKFYTVILRDVSERIRNEKLLERSEARLRGILDSAMDAIITVDDRQRVVFYNDAAEAMFGWSREEADGAPLSMFIPERFRNAHGKHVELFGETGTTSRRMGSSLRVVTGLRRNNEEFPIDASISQIETSGRRFYTVILRDVTARFQAVEALRRSKQELQQLGAAAHLTREQEKSRIARELHVVRLSPLALTTVVEDATAGRRFQLVQMGADLIALRLEALDARERDAQWHAARHALHDYLALQSLNNVRLVLDTGPPIVDLRSGKFREVIATDHA